MKQKAHFIHPFLFAAYPVLSLLAINIDQIDVQEAIKPLLVLWGGTAVFLVLFRILFKTWERAAFAVTWLLFLTFSFTHILNLLQKLLPTIAEGTLFLSLFVLFAILIILGTWWIGRKKVRTDLRPLTTFLNVVGLVMVALPLFTIITNSVRSASTSTASSFNQPTDTSITEPVNYPDIYYIIVDGYGRADVLDAMYDYDNDPFLTYLHQTGFTVLDNSYSNYMQTNLSLASSLNYSYLDELVTAVGRQEVDRSPLIQSIKNSAVRQYLENLGYQIIIHDSGLPDMNLNSNSYEAETRLDMLQNLQNKLDQQSYFVNLLLRNTMFGPFLVPIEDAFGQHRQLITHNLEETVASAALDGPKLVITHVLAPHPPFVFAEDGTYLTPDYDYEVFDGNHYAGSTDLYVDGYRGQLAHLNTLLETTIDGILQNSANEPIIILQGDHGPGSQLDWESVDDSCVHERLAILNAILLPSYLTATPEIDMSPVNTFRFVFNNAFATDLEILPDESYFSLWDAPYDFINVTDLRETACSQP